MKRAVWRFCTLAAALVTCLSAAAQVAFDEIRETPAKGYGVYYVTEFPAATPDGVKATALSVRFAATKTASPA